LRKSSLVLLGEDHGRWEETGKAPLKILRYMGSGMYERCGSELERPYLPPEGKEGTYKRKRNRSLGRRESERFILPIMLMKQNVI
jgi:hypothetical protein